MGLGVRQGETAAKEMAQLVVEAHIGACQRGPGEPGAIEGLLTCLDIAGRGHDRGQGGGQHADRFFRHERDDGARIRRIERLDGVGQRVHPARPGHRGRQIQSERRVVDHRPRQHPRVATGALDAAFGNTPDRRHLGSRVGRGDRHDRELALERDRLGQADRRAAADCHATIDVAPAGLVAGLLGAIEWHVHDRVGVDGGTGPKRRGRGLGGRAPAGAADDHHPAGAERANLFGEPVDGAGAEDDAGGRTLVYESHRAAGGPGLRGFGEAPY